MVFAADTASSLPLQQVLHSTVHNPAMFNNNNNYLPNLNQFGPAQLPVSTVAASAQPSDMSPAPGTLQAGMPYQMLGNQPLRHFRFLSPTQGATVPTWVPPANTMGMATAPGVGVSWQHSVPTTMPWAHHTAPNFNAEITPTSSVQSPTQQSFPPSASDRFSQSQSVPAPVQRRKRHSHDEDTPQGPSSKKYLSERMAAWFKQLHIAPVQQSSSGGPWDSGAFRKRDNGWQRFCEVERRLETGVEEAEIEEADNRMSESSGEPRLVFAEGVSEEILTPSPVLPKAIISTLTKPCMELVLYKEPGILHAVAVTGSAMNSSGIISMDSNTETSSVPNPQLGVNGHHEGAVAMNGISAAALPGLHSSGINPSSALLNRNTSDTDMFDNIDDDMDL